MALVAKTITCFVSGAGELWLSILICLGQHKLQTDLFSFHGLSTRGSHGCLLLPWIWLSSTTQTAFWGNGEVFIWFLSQIDFDNWCVMVDGLGEAYPSLLSFSKSLQSSGLCHGFTNKIYSKEVTDFQKYKNFYLFIYYIGRRNKHLFACAKHVFVFFLNWHLLL